MPDQLPLEPGERRRFVVVVGIITVVTALLIDETMPVRIVTASIVGLFSGFVFALTVVLLDRFAPEYR